MAWLQVPRFMRCPGIRSTSCKDRKLGKGLCDLMTSYIDLDFFDSEIYGNSFVDGGKRDANFAINYYEIIAGL